MPDLPRAQPVDRRATAKADAARSIFQNAGLEIDESDPMAWIVDKRWTFSPLTGAWRRPDGTAGGGGAGKLVEAIRAEG